MKTELERLREAYEIKTNNGYYNQGAYLIADYLGLKLKVLDCEYKSHSFDKNGAKRHVFKLQLQRNRKQYTFEFGQSIAQGNNEPTLYDVLTCLQKYDVGTFEDFCGDFGYDTDSRTAEKIHKAVVKEFQAMQRLFSDDELEVLQMIQ